MRYQPIEADFYRSRRALMAGRMSPGGLLVLVSNDRMPTNADSFYPFRQHNDLFYLSGIDQEETALILFPDAPRAADREILLIRRTSEELSLWEGEKLSPARARERSGIGTIRFFDELETVLRPLVYQSQSFYLNANEHLRSGTPVITAQDRLNQTLRTEYPLHEFKRAAPHLTYLRQTKAPAEVAQMQRAMDITASAFELVLQQMKPGQYEYEIEALVHGEFLRQGAQGPAYDSIIAGGKNACVLHYVQNDQHLKAGDLVLMDFGCSYGNYAADLSRTIPVSGRFSERQLAVYQSVLRVLKSSTDLLVVGNTFQGYLKEVVKMMESELIALGLLDRTEVQNQHPERPLYRRYFPHGISHSLGLDVHDVEDRSRPFEAGMVFTCEPGIYIPEEGIGIRLENNILIEASGPKNLMSDIPLEAKDIEERMRAKAI